MILKTFSTNIIVENKQLTNLTPEWTNTEGQHLKYIFSLFLKLAAKNPTLKVDMQSLCDIKA